MDIRMSEMKDRNVTQVAIERYGFPVPRVWTGGLQIHCRPVSRPNASDICEYCRVSGQAARTVASMIWSPQWDIDRNVTGEFGEMMLVNPIANSQTPMIMQR